jgi:thiamine monophosphate synthase
MWLICPETLKRYGYSIDDIPLIYEDLSEDLRAQVTLVYRDKINSPHDAFAQLSRLRNQIPDAENCLVTYGPPSWVHDLQLAGLHLPDNGNIQEVRSQLEGNVSLGISRHRSTLQGNEGKEGADYIFLSPIFTPISKTIKNDALGLTEFKLLARKADTKVFALGGVNSTNMPLIKESEIFGAVFLGAIFQSAKSRTTLQEICSSW